MAQQTEQQKQWAKIVAKAWADENYKARLLAEPKVVLLEEGVELNEEVSYKVVEAAANQVVLVLPAQADVLSSTNEGEERRSAWLFK